jgi:uncharacterized protein YqjF (DUF2071 family)
VRTYVSAGGKPGIWFFSLDTSSQLAVEGARRTYKLPYFRARMSVDRRGETVDYSSVRSGDARPFVFQARYRPRGEVSQSQPGSLEHFLTERYCLFAAEGERLFRADIHHPPWPLRGAEIELELNTMAPNGIELPDEVLLLHFSHRQDVLIWPLEPVGSEPV